VAIVIPAFARHPMQMREEVDLYTVSQDVERSSSQIRIFAVLFGVSASSPFFFLLHRRRYHQHPAFPHFVLIIGVLQVLGVIDLVLGATNRSWTQLALSMCLLLLAAVTYRRHFM
jgi:hypothetical protein